jgi:hypothetical protein
VPQVDAVRDPPEPDQRRNRQHARGRANGGCARVRDDHRRGGRRGQAAHHGRARARRRPP